MDSDFCCCLPSPGTTGTKWWLVSRSVLYTYLLSLFHLKCKSAYFFGLQSILPGQWHFTHILNICNFCTHSLHWYNMYVVFCTVYYSLTQYDMPHQTLVHKFGVAAVKGVARNNNITEFQLKPEIRDQQVVDGILAQLTADERRKFRVRKDVLGLPSIELCPVGEWCIVSLLMQCLCCVGPVLSQLCQRSSLSIPSWLCWVGGPALSCVWTVHHL